MNTYTNKTLYRFIPIKAAVLLFSVKSREGFSVLTLRMSIILYLSHHLLKVTFNPE